MTQYYGRYYPVLPTSVASQVFVRVGLFCFFANSKGDGAFSKGESNATRVSKQVVRRQTVVVHCYHEEGRSLYLGSGRAFLLFL